MANLTAQAQYSETFSTANKGYLTNLVDDFTGMNWTLTAWPFDDIPNNIAGRDATDYFQTTAAGRLESIDLDLEICWEGPLMTVNSTGNIMFTADLTWNGFDPGQTFPFEYINVEYKINNGAWVRHPNVIGANGDPAYTVRYVGGSGAQNGMATTDFGNIAVTAGDAFRVRICVSDNANAELVTIDNVNVTGVSVGCPPPSLSTVVTPVGCSNPNSGAIDLSVSAGTPGYTYSWTGGITTQDLTNKPTGTYTVTVTDAGSCSATISATISNAPAITLTTQVLDATCSSTQDGEIGLDVSGGVPGYTYDWSNDGPEAPDNDAQDLIGVGSGTYTVTVTDVSGCTKTTSGTVGVQPAGAYNEQFNTPNKGYLNNLVDDFAGVNWSMSSWTTAPPATFGRDNDDNFSTSSGKLTGVDFDQEVCWTTPTIDFTGGSQFSVELSWTGFDNEDYITVSYSIDGGAFVQIPNVIGGGAGTIQYNTTDQSGSTTLTKTGLSGGTIVIQICANMNSQTEVITIDNVSVPGSGGPYCPAPEPNLTAVNVTCNGGSNGSITNTVSNGSAPFTYAWSNFAVTQNLTGIPAGTYTVTVTDANAATGTASITVTQPTAIVPTETHVNVLCNGAATGSIDLSVTGGTPGYTYNWGGGVTTQDRSGLTAGTYTVTVTDANTCTKTLSVTITEPATGIVLTETHVNILCNGAATGSIDLTVSGGNPGYLYSWTGGASTQDRSGLTAGTYTVTVTDANTCTKTLSVTITQPTAVVLTETHVNVLCNGNATGSIDLTVTGGTPGYTYLWSNGGVTTQDQSGLAAGTYTVTTTDANACTKTTSVTITQPTALSLTTTQVNVLCNGAATGSIDLTVTGGTAGYTYSWTGGATTQDRSGLTAGTYTVTVTDANSCTQTISATITEPATGINLSTTQVDVLCNGAATGSIDLTVSGGNPGYLYSWTGGASTQDRSGLTAGTYTVTVTDANTCTKTISVTIAQPTAVSLSTTQVNVLCNGNATGSIDLTVGGGTPGYTYLWSNGGVTTQDQSGLAAGTYTVTTTDANACTKTTSVTITQPTALSLTTTQVNVLCNGAATGSIDLTVTGGTAGYTYSWTGGATTQDRSGLTAGTYTVTVTDANSCTKTLSATITEPATGINLSTTKVDVLCNGAATGSIDLTVSGGTPGYTYNWGGGISTQDRSGLTAGTYTVTVTDANSCTKTISATIAQPTVVLLSTSQGNVLCNGGSTGSIDLTVSGGTPGYTYVWSNGGVTTQDQSSLPAGTYTVTVTDANACTKTISATISQPTALSLSSTFTNPSNCPVADGSINLSVSGGTPGFTYDWSNDGPETPDNDPEDLSGLLLGTYTVTVTDANSCSAVHTRTLTVTDLIAPSITCPGPQTINANASCQGSIGAYAPATLSDNCSATPAIVVTQSPASGTVLTGHNASVTVFLTAKDEANNTSSCNFTVTLKDVTVPSITCPANTTVNANASCQGQVGSYSATSVSDNCNPSPTVTQSPAASTILSGHNATQTVTLTANDGNGNTNTCSLVVTLKDVTPPTLSCPANATVNANASCQSAVGSYAPATLSDNCNPVPTVTQSPASSTLLTGHNATTLVTLTANDGNGNTATCNFSVTLKDVSAPSISCPANVTIAANASCGGSLGAYAPVSVADNCNASPTVTQSPASGTALSGHNDFRTVTLTANDGNGNTNSCNFTVTLKDVTQPNISCPANVTINANASCSGNLGVYSPTSVSDNCTASPSVTQSPASGTLISGANTVSTVTLTATDGAGNTRTCTLTVTLKDVTPPTIVCAAYTANLNAIGTVTIVPANVYQSGSDNCGTVNLVSVVPSAFTCSNIGPNTVVLTANDGNGNTSTCNAVVTVKDVTPPVAICQNVTANLNSTGSVTIAAASVSNGTSDNCSFTLLLTPSTFTCANIGINTVTLRATDAGGNSSTCTAKVTIKDASGPTAKCTNPTIFLNSVGHATLSAAQVDNGSTDNCGIATRSINLTSFNCSELAGSPWPVTLSLQDVNGNTSSCLAYVTVRDAIAPTPVCEDVTVQLNSNGKVTVYGADLAYNSVDNCSVWSYSPIAKVYTTANIGNNNLTVTVKDWSNNPATCVSVVTVLPYNPGQGDHPAGFDTSDPGLIDFVVYPNPTSGEATMAFLLAAEQSFVCRIFDTAGRLIYSHKDMGVEGENVMPLHLEGMAPGVYLIDFQSEKWTVQKRLLIQE